MMGSTSIFSLDRLDKIAVFAGGLFAGTALYITVAEVPALEALGLDEHWRFFPHMYARAAAPQATFTIVAGITGAANGLRQANSFDRNLWLAAGSAFIAMWPYTIVFLASINTCIINDNRLIQAGEQSRVDPATRKELLGKWNMWHLGRTIGSVVAFGAMIYGLNRH